MPFQRPTRRRFLAGLGAGGVTAVSGCASSRSTPATAALDWPSDEWPVAHGTPTNTGYTRSKSAPRTNPPMHVWKLWERVESEDEKKNILHGTTSSPIVSNGTVFVATGLPSGFTIDADGKLYALDATTGKTKWSATLPKGGTGTPAVADGLVFAGSADRALTAFDAASGAVRWRTTTSAPVGTPTVAGGNVYVGDRHGSVHAFRRTDGKLEWRYGQRTLGSFFSEKTWWIRSKPAVTDDAVYVSTGIGQNGRTTSSNLLALSRDDGGERWRYEFSQDRFSYEPPRAPVVADGTVFVSDTSLHAVDPSDGTKRWQFAFGYRRPVSAPAVHDGSVYIGAKNVYSISAEDGTEQWRFVNRASMATMEHRVPMESAPVVTDETVYIGAGALDSSSGEKLWGDLGNQDDSQFFLSDTNENATLEGPAIAGDAVFVATEYGSIIRFADGDA
ncbi:PQQ-binding-like beta-propeller repeat protein [Haladaptatus sp. AB618]|uniref:outer membrane protein assembly factor BamB family protein n=1 Tax=Haladaptatus sp. AB618 TaxID=2934173 RepID=UPI00209BC8D5|nr:PQQ-binding-like beta-propeller repeat protein [Haladaptatus sp. AB618]MCO8254724.1 PQQ-binding-like beta-propeller repeat protein [Haladaptatus sp. AB618]